jgi:high-affinity K+ transport system ATPase subunit B
LLSRQYAAQCAHGHGRGTRQAQAETLRRARTTTMAKKLPNADRSGPFQEVAAPDLRKGDVVLDPITQREMQEEAFSLKLRAPA